MRRQYYYLALSLVNMVLAVHSVIEGWVINIALQGPLATAFFAIFLYKNETELGEKT